MNSRKKTKMIDVYRENKTRKKQERNCLLFAFLISFVLLLAILLVFFLHPRNQTWAYFALSLLFLLLLVLGDYYFLFYKFAHLKAIDSFLKMVGKHKDNAIFIFKNEKGVRYVNKLSFKEVLFTNEENEEIVFLYLEECHLSFKKDEKYLLSFERNYLFGYEEENDEE